MHTAEKLIHNHTLTKDEYIELLYKWNDPYVMNLLQKEAFRLRELHYSNKIFVRGLIEFTNYCKNDCYYCGIRRSNKNVGRYRLTKEEILECCRYGYELGFRTFVLQGGEDPYYSDEKMTDIVSAIKIAHPDCAVTLSIGEKTYDSSTLHFPNGLSYINFSKRLCLA